MVVNNDGAKENGKGFLAIVNCDSNSLFICTK